ncbi:MAG TPA: thiopurine S-methyltransferase [Hyphomicrobium sp.]|jgi:thiopurine S-methyltransferase
MDTTFWRERWRNQDIGFHQPMIHALLEKHWPRVGLNRGSAVFVPLCGKSLDMVWLAEQGHMVVGAELSEIAIDSFFAERGLEPAVRAVGSFLVKTAGPYELWCGDIFDLPHDAVAGIAGVYDRAALVAFPADLQQRYCEKLKELLPAAAPILLITLDYDSERMTGPPFAVPRRQVDRLFADSYAISELECRDALDASPHLRQRGLTALREYAYLLRRS